MVPLTVDQLIAELQAQSAAGFGSCPTWLDRGPHVVLTPVGRVRVAFDAATKAADVWLSPPADHHEPHRA